MQAVNERSATALGPSVHDAAAATAVAAAAADAVAGVASTPALELPSVLLDLLRAYEAMATVAAFFRAREHMVCTFEKIRPAVEGILGRCGHARTRAIPARSLTPPSDALRPGHPLALASEVTLDTVARLRVVALTHLQVAWIDVAPANATAFMVSDDGQMLPPPPSQCQLQLRFGHEPQHRRPYAGATAPFVVAPCVAGGGAKELCRRRVLNVVARPVPAPRTLPTH